MNGHPGWRAGRVYGGSWSRASGDAGAGFGADGLHLRALGLNMDHTGLLEHGEENTFCDLGLEVVPTPDVVAVRVAGEKKDLREAGEGRVGASPRGGLFISLTSLKIDLRISFSSTN